MRSLCVVLLTAIFAFASVEETPMPPGMLMKIVNLLEWTIGTPLSASDKLQIQETQTAAWRANQGQTRAQMEMLVKTYDLIQVMPVDQKEKVREQMRAALKQSLPAPNGKSAPSAIPPVLAGEWTSMHTSGVMFTNKATGSWAPPSGNGTQYKFFPDGRFQSASLIQSSLYNCTLTVNAWEEGTIEVNGNAITFHSRGGTLDSKDNCSQGSNYKKTLPANDKSYTWRMKQDEWGTYFCIVAPGIKEDCARRQTEK